MIEISCHITDKRTGRTVFDGFKNGSAKFDSIEEFYFYMRFRYGFDADNHSFSIGGRVVA